MGQDERGAIGLLDDFGHGECLAGAGDAEQDLMAFSSGEAFHEFSNGAGLITARLVGGDELKVH
jgi:hypothetical protein